MSEKKVSTAPMPIDGYDDEGDASPSRGARYVKFDAATQSLWFLRETGGPMLLGPYYAPDIWEEQLKWIDKVVVARIRKEPGRSLPHTAELNDESPKNEWAPDFNGVLQGPWRHTNNVGLVSPDDGSRFIVSNSTTGMRIGFEDLRERVQFMRKLRGRVVPLVELSSAQMRTRFGRKARPSFKILDWRALDGPSVPATAAPAVQEIPPPTTEEIISDQIPF